ncbi:MAG: RHS repeat protein [Bdellovibrionales bacterium]|nr:RHS repeat protein [Bdellovibrionales bacterium]
MKRIFLSWMILIVSTPFAFATVDMRTANLVDTWNDLIAQNSGYDLRIQRVYNSRTIFSGIFGFGWCSDFETTLDISPEGNLSVTECGGGAQITYQKKSFQQNEVNKTINTILAEVKKRNPSRNSKYLSGLRTELKENKYLRAEFARQLKLVGKVESGKEYLANGRENDSIVLKNNIYIRSLPDGTFQRFDKKGHLVAMHDRNGNHLKIRYEKDLIRSVVDNNGRQLNFQYFPNTKHVKIVTGPDGLKSVYTYKGDDLHTVTNAWNQKYSYNYDELHNLTKMTFPDGTTKELTYNKDKDWVTSFKNRKGCLETYSYESDPKDPLNHYWSTVKKECNKQITNISKYEFWNKVGKKGKYLYRAKTNVNGKITDVVYHPTFGRPISVLANNRRTNFDYYDNGLVKLRYDDEVSSLFRYDNPCNKVSMVEITPVDKSKKTKGKRRVANKYLRYTKFFYDEVKCNLVGAKTSSGLSVSLNYDTRGRIAEIKDQSKKTVRIQYESRFGKPALIQRPGLGAITVTYKTDGSVDKTVSKEGPQVARQVASVFNNLLEVIAPATSELNI